MVSNRRSLPPLNALRAFEVAGRSLNFRAAADELGVTQGAVAQQVRLLEDHLGLPLFQRLPRGLSLTAKGAVYLAGVSRAFDGLTEATAQLNTRPATVTISVTPSFATRILIPRLADLSAALPGVELRILATEAVSDFDRDQVDIAVRLTRPPFAPGLEAALLFRQHLIAVASPHLVGPDAGTMPPERVQAFPLLHDAHNSWPRFLGGAARPPGASFNQTTLALAAAMAGQGIALACQAFVEADLQAGRLVQVGDRKLAADADYYLVRKDRSQQPEGANSVWGWCRSFLAFDSAGEG